MRNAEPVLRSRFRSWFALLLVGIATAAGVSGCGHRQSEHQVLADKGTPYSDLLVPKLTATVKDGEVGVAVDKPVKLTVQGGVLDSVAVVDDEGDAVAGDISPDGLNWTATDPLAYNKHYTVTAQSLGLGGAATETLSFKSHSPANLTMPYVSPGDGAVVGVGQPIAVRFDEHIPNRVAAEKAITVTTDPPSRVPSTGSATVRCAGAPRTSGTRVPL